VERTERHKLLAARLERQVLADELDDVGRLLDLDFGVVVIQRVYPGERLCLGRDFGEPRRCGFSVFPSDAA